MEYQLEQKFNSFDELNSFPHGWDTEFSTTTPDKYSIVLKQAVAPGLLVNTAELSSPTLQRASTPKNMRTFAFPLQVPRPYLWRGISAANRTCITFPNDRELFSIVGENSKLLTISIDQQTVQSYLSSWEMSDNEVFDRPYVTDLSEAQYHTLHRHLERLTEFMCKYGDHQRFPELSLGIQEYLLDNLLHRMLTDVTLSKTSIPLAAKRVQAAADYIVLHLNEPLSVVAVCEHIGCSRRSLEQSFQTFAGISPKRFIQILRFNHCRRALLTADPRSAVNEIATKHGFWHMGQFSADYKRLFRELPSQTLRTRKALITQSSAARSQLGSHKLSPCSDRNSVTGRPT